MKKLVRRTFPVPGQGLGRNPVAMHGAPVTFTAGATGLASGQSVVLDASALQSGYRAAYWVDEIRMQVFTDLASTDDNDFGYLPLSTRFQFRTGSYKFSQVCIPMQLYTPIYNAQSVLGLNPVASGHPGTYEPNGDNTRVAFDARWILPKPLWMPPGDGIQCTVDRDSVAPSDFNINVDVLYIGRACAPAEPAPASRAVPWVSYYVHNMETDLYSHTNQEFRNPFTVPWNIHRLVARLYPQPAQYTGLFQPFLLPDDVGDPYITMRIDDSTGYKIIGGGGADATAGGSGSGFVAAGAVFDTTKMAWTFSRALEGREQLNMQFQQQPLGTALQDSPTALMIGALGYRQEGV